MGLSSQVSFSSNIFRNYTNSLANGFLIPTQILIQNLGIILRIAAKVKISVLLTSPLPVLIYLVPITLRKILAEVLMLLGIKVLRILLIITLRQIRRLLLLLLVVKLLSYSSFLLIEQFYIVPLRCLQDTLLLGINFILQGSLYFKLQ